MKIHRATIIFCFLGFISTVSSQECYAREPVRGQITDAIRERIALSTGDKVTISVGKNQGLIRGDIGKIVSSRTGGGLEIGRCIVEESYRDSSVCQIIESLREVGRGDLVLFDGVDYRDKMLFPAIIDILDSSVKPYPIHEKVRMLIHEIFDGKNNVTLLSEKVSGELIYIASQKKRIVPVSTRDISDVSYYPNEYKPLAEQIKDYLRKRNLDLLLTGTYVINGSTLELSFQRVSREGDDRVIVFPIPTTNFYNPNMDRIVLPYVKKERHSSSLCSVLYKPRQYVPPKEEKSAIIKDEAGDDPFRELNLKRVEFNIISPVDFKVGIDGTVVKLGENNAGAINLGSGPHRVRASFRRGYYSNESLLYASTREFTRDAVIELTKDQELVLEVLADPLPDKGDPLVFKVYRKAERERHALKPIQRFESEKVIETFIE